jgi:hypothetical protein
MAEFHEENLGRYLRYLCDQSASKPLTRDQIFLSSLAHGLQPFLNAIRLRRRISALRAALGSWHTSEHLIEPVRSLSFEAYHFRESIKDIGDTALNCMIDETSKQYVRRKFGEIIRTYQRGSERWIRYRNFVVHGPRNRQDPFRDLTFMELGAVTLHNDLWLDFRNMFDEDREYWSTRAKSLLQSMSLALVTIECINDKLISERKFSFASDFSEAVGILQPGRSRPNSRHLDRTH